VGLDEVVVQGLGHGQHSEVGEEEEGHAAHGGSHVCPVPDHELALAGVLKRIHKRADEACT
jgi:hypothetical protein